ncbi:MAG TPA: FAD-dependent oxidoreductase [Steroidobacteraceae bacterium]
MRFDADVAVVGGGPAGTAAAILLANAGWDVVLIEQHRFPRHKVCGECIAAGNLALLDRLGIGEAFRERAGPEIRQVGWISAARTVVAEMPACTEGPYRYGRALGRDCLDELLMARARSAGVQILQPASVRRISGGPGRFACRYVVTANAAGDNWGADECVLNVPVVVDAHGSWQRAPGIPDAPLPSQPLRRLDSDLLAFKARFRDGNLPSGFLPVLSFPGGYGGLVVADQQRITLACCIRRDALRKCRALAAGVPAGAAIEAHLRRCCRGVAEALENAQREGPWLAVGPIRPGIDVEAHGAGLRIGNAAGESHPLVGEGISMALQSASLLVHHLKRRTPRSIDSSCSAEVERQYAVAWRREFAARLRFAALYAHSAMSPALAAPTSAILRRLPRFLTLAARLAGKARQLDVSLT